MENAKQEKKVGVEEVVLNSLADHMKNNSENLKKKKKQPKLNRIIYTKLHFFFNVRMPDFNILFIVLSEKYKIRHRLYLLEYNKQKLVQLWQ